MARCDWHTQGLRLKRQEIPANNLRRDLHANKLLQSSRIGPYWSTSFYEVVMAMSADEALDCEYDGAYLIQNCFPIERPTFANDYLVLYSNSVSQAAQTT